MTERTGKSKPKPTSGEKALSDRTRAFDLEKPIQTVIDATNRGDTPRLLGAFADDAVLIDWGRTFAGKAEIARWNADENIGTENKLHVTGVQRSGYEVKVDVAVSGKGYNGPGVLSFLVDGDLVKRMAIA